MLKVRILLAEGEMVEYDEVESCLIIEMGEKELPAEDKGCMSSAGDAPDDLTDG